MTLSGRTRTILLSAAILVFGIIHLGVGIGIVAKYSQYDNVFQQQVGLAGYNIVIALLAIFVGIVGIIAAVHQSVFFSKVATIASLVLSIFVLASLITALALSGSTAGYIFDTMTDNMNRYASNQRSLEVVNAIQSNYECCGVSLWLDWARVYLGGPVGTVNGRRRRRSDEQELSTKIDTPLIQSVRQTRQFGDNSFNLPGSYGVTLPLSCCRSGGVSSNGNSVGGNCVYFASNGTNGFYIEGCFRPIANIAFSQITGIAVINTVLLMLALVKFVKMITVFRKDPNQNNPYNQQQQQQQQAQYQYTQDPQAQYQYDQYYTDYNNQNAYYTPNDSNYKMYL